MYNKIPKIALAFWAMKLAATVLGETGSDFVSKAEYLGLGYALTSIIFVGFFLAVLPVQLASKKYHPVIYWTVILGTLLAGTAMSDCMDRTLGFGYAWGSAILIAVLLCVLAYWRFSVGSLSVYQIKTGRVEVLYWIAILASNTLGTALGDFLADDFGWGFGHVAMLMSGLLALTLLATLFTRVSRVALFWIAFVLTRPFGATMGDVLIRPAAEGGLAFGAGLTSAILASGVVLCVVAATIYEKKCWEQDAKLQPQAIDRAENR